MTYFKKRGRDVPPQFKPMSGFVTAHGLQRVDCASTSAGSAARIAASATRLQSRFISIS
jgi:hypothetical protein